MDAWRQDLAAALVVYDPGAKGRTVRAGPYRFHHVPGRECRPGSWNVPDPPAAGLFDPWRPGPFAEPDFVSDREVVRIRRGGRTTHLVCNRYPVVSPHWLGVRSLDAPPTQLGQLLHSVAEIEDLVLLLRRLGPGYRIYFNSNRGADGSNSGSSVNHWHSQIFPYAEEEPFRWTLATGVVDAVRQGELLDWPGRHRIVEAPVERWRELCTATWDLVDRLHQRNVAYNLELRVGEGVGSSAAHLVSLLFARRPAGPTSRAGMVPLSAGFGGWELTGDFVLPTTAWMDWVESHPEEAEQLARQRLTETTRAIAV